MIEGEGAAEEKLEKEAARESDEEEEVERAKEEDSVDDDSEDRKRFALSSLSSVFSTLFPFHAPTFGHVAIAHFHLKKNKRERSFVANYVKSGKKTAFQTKNAYHETIKHCG